MIVEHTRFPHHGYTCLIQRHVPNWPHSFTDQTFRVLVDGLHVATAGVEADALQYARAAAKRFAEELHASRLVAARLVDPLRVARLESA